MNKQEIQKAVNTLLFKQMSPYTVGQVPMHTHNGVDSQNLNMPTRTFVGDLGGTISFLTPTQYSLPRGWDVQASGGTYVVHHYLNTMNYAVTAVHDYTNGATVLIPGIVLTENAFALRFYDTTTGFINNTDSHFILTVVGNYRNTSEPSVSHGF